MQTGRQADNRAGLRQARARCFNGRGIHQRQGGKGARQLHHRLRCARDAGRVGHGLQFGRDLGHDHVAGLGGPGGHGHAGHRHQRFTAPVRQAQGTAHPGGHHAQQHAARRPCSPLPGSNTLTLMQAQLAPTRPVAEGYMGTVSGRNSESGWSALAGLASRGRSTRTRHGRYWPSGSETVSVSASDPTATSSGAVAKARAWWASGNHSWITSSPLRTAG